MPTIDEQLAALAATWEAQRTPITPDEATERSYVVLDAPRLPVAPRRRVLLAVAAVFVLLVGAGAWVVARSDGRQRPAAGDDSPWWLPSVVPGGWKLQQALAPAPVGPLAFGSAVSGARAIFVTVGGDPQPSHFSEPVMVGARRGTITSLPFGRLSLTLELDTWVEIRAVGVSEDELFGVAASFEPGRTWRVDAFPLVLPADFPPMRPSVASTTRLDYVVSVQFQATVAVNPDPAVELARLATLVGPLADGDAPEPRLLGHADEWHGQGGRTVAYRRVGGLAVTVEMGDAGLLTDEAMQVADAMDVTSEPAFRARAATASLQQAGLRAAVCEERVPPSSRFQPVEVEVPGGRTVSAWFVPDVRFGGRSGVVCASVPGVGGVGQAFLPTDVPGSIGELFSPAGGVLAGIAPDLTATVQVETSDWLISSVEASPLVGTTFRVWAVPLGAGATVRSIAFVDGAGKVLLRVGRPAR